MANKGSCCCSGLPRSLWWLVTLLGLPMLYFFMLSEKWEPIEKNIHARMTEQLSSKGADFTIDLTGRGRDALLTGTVETEAQRETLIKNALAVEGVRTVDSELTVSPLTPPQFSLQTSDEGKVVLSGVMPSQEGIDALYTATVDAYGEDKVENQLTLGKRIAKPEWLTGISAFIPVLKAVEGGNLELSDGSKKISGVVHTDEKKSSVLAQAKDAFSDIEDGITVTPLEASALTARYTHSTGQLMVEGVLSSQDKMDELLKFFADKVGADNIINKLTIDDQYATEGGTIVLSGSVLNDNDLSDISLAIKKGSDALGLTLTNNMEIDLATVKLAEDKAKSEKLANEETKAEADKKAKAARLASQAESSACQQKLNTTMSGKTILFETNKANIKSSSFTLLKKIARIISECSTTLPDANIAISGHTDSRGSDAHNLALSDRRANAVKKYLISIGVGAEIISSKGYGETQPVASNDTAEGRTKNRRITFSVQ